MPTTFLTELLETTDYFSNETHDYVHPTPEFSLTKPRSDMGTFAGRCAYFYTAIDPRMCLRTSRSIEDARALLRGYKDGTLAHAASNEELWAARATIDACVHPTTNQPTHPLLRFSAFIPVRFATIAFMMQPSTVASPARTIFIHWFNQTYISCVNYSNRASDGLALGTVLQAYAAGMSAGLCCALGATYAMKRMGSAPSPRTAVVRAVLPFLAVGTSGAANLCLTRQSEWRGEGIAVADEDGEVRGKSRAAGRMAVLECCAPRYLWNVPPMLLPPLLLIPLVKRHPAALETLLVAAGMAVGVAPALALFPLRETVAASALEAEFHALRRRNGEPVRHLTFYKGL